MIFKVLFQVARLVLILVRFSCMLTCPECAGESWSNGPGYHEITCNGCGFVHKE